MSHPFVILDIDGTVCENGHRIDWGNPESIYHKSRPIRQAQARVSRMYKEGWMPYFLTARHTSAFRVTFLHVGEWFGHKVAQDSDIVCMDARISGLDWTAMKQEIIEYKRAWLEEVKTDELCIYVGDRLEDKEAAEAAGWTFMWAHEWRAGLPWPGQKKEVLA